MKTYQNQIFKTAKRMWEDTQPQWKWQECL